MSNHVRNDIDRRLGGNGSSHLLAALWDPFLVAAFVCAAFSSAGAAVVGLYEASRGFPDGAGFAIRLVVKVLIFGVAAAGLAYALLRRRSPQPVVPQELTPSASWRVRVVVLVGLAAMVSLALPKLDSYPWIAPDESHHLIVARNLALYGRYASGHPETGLSPFDAYDSVGAPVILPVAAALHLGGISARTGRLPIALYACLLFVAAYAFAAPAFGARAAAFGAWMLLMAGSTVYLSRTLYGEVPAVFYLVLGLTLWRRALQRPAWRIEGLLAGLCFGAAVLCKAIVLLSAFAFLGAWIYDRATARRIGARHIVGPAIGFALIYGAWSLYQAMAGGASSGLADILALYKPLLLFGFDSVDDTLRALFRHPAELVTGVGGLLVAMPVAFHRRYDPPAIVLLMTAAVYIFWWTFFTEGQLPRYLWLGYGPAAVGAGLMLDVAVDVVCTRGRPWRPRLAWLAVLTVVVVPALAWTAQQAGLVYSCDETYDERALAEHIRDVPPGISIGSTYYPLCRTLDFLTGRPVALVIPASSDLTPCDIVAIDTRTQSDFMQGITVAYVCGRYAVARTED